MSADAPDTRDFAARSTWSDLGGEVHWMEFFGPAEATPVVAVHGLGGSHVNWLAIAELLARGRRVALLDLHGHGRTSSVGRDTSVAGNAALLARFVGEVLGRPAVLLGNSMGGMISLRVAAEHPELVAGVIGVGSVLPIAAHRLPEPAVALGVAVTGIPRLGSAILRVRRSRVTPRQQVEEMLRLCCVDPTAVPEWIVGLEVDLVTQRRTTPGLEAGIERAARTTVRAALERPAYDRVLDRVRAPVLLIHGERDRLVPVESAHRAARRHPAWQVVTRPGVGHVPMLEEPDATLEVIEPWLAALPPAPRSLPIA